MATILDPAHVTLGTTDTEIVAQVGAGVKVRVFLLITNTDVSDHKVWLHRYDAGSAESADQDNAVYYGFDLGGGGEQIVEVSMTLSAGWKVSGRASVASAINVHVDSIQE